MLWKKFIKSILFFSPFCLLLSGCQKNYWRWYQIDPYWTKLLDFSSSKLHKESWDYIDEIQKNYPEKNIFGTKKLKCENSIDSILLWSYGPGYYCWNEPLHRDKSTKELDNDDVVKGNIGIPSPKDPSNWDWMNTIKTNYEFKKSDYKLLDQILNISNVGVDFNKGYHGFEHDEVDLLEFLEELDINIYNDDLDSIKKQIEIVNKQIYDDNKKFSYIDYGFLAMGAIPHGALRWIDFQDTSGFIEKPLTVTPFFEFNIDYENVKGLYVSRSDKVCYDNVHFSAPIEYQLLCQRNLKITITNLRIEETAFSKLKLLWINADLTTQ